MENKKMINSANGLTLNERQREMIVDFGAFAYNAKKISVILELPFDFIEKSLKDESTEIHKLYFKGLYTAEYVLDKKMFDLAQQGDIKAIDRLKSRIMQRK